jgi:hypothetical protein
MRYIEISGYGAKIQLKAKCSNLNYLALKGGVSQESQ